MYANMKHNGIKLAEWQKIFNRMFSLGELYTMHVSGFWPRTC